MSSGFKYDLVPPVEQEERHDVQTGIRRRGPFKLDTQRRIVTSGKFSFWIYADLCGLEKQVRLCGNQCESCGSLYYWWRGFVYQDSKGFSGLCGHVYRKRQERCRSNGNDMILSLFVPGMATANVSLPPWPSLLVRNVSKINLIYL